MQLARGESAHYQRGCLAILFASILWGTTGTAASFAPAVSPLAIGAFAMGVGGLLQAFLARKAILNNISNSLLFKKYFIIGAIALAIYPLAFYSSMKYSGVAIGTVVSIASAPFFCVLIECLFSKRLKITRYWVFSFILGVIGVFLLSSSEPSAAVKSNYDLKLFGILLGLIAGLSYAVYSWIAKVLIDNGVQSQAALGSIFTLGATILLPSLIFTGGNLFSSIETAAVVIYMAIVPMCVGYIAFGYGLRFVSATGANLLTLFEPVIAAVLAVTIVGEFIPMSGWLGIALIMLCIGMQTIKNETA